MYLEMFIGLESTNLGSQSITYQRSEYLSCSQCSFCRLQTIDMLFRAVHSCTVIQYKRRKIHAFYLHWMNRFCVYLATSLRY